MRFDLSKILLERNGEAVKGPEEKPLTVNGAVVIALDILASQEKLSGEEKVKRFKLACRIHGEVLPIELSPEEVTLIRKLVNEAFPSPLVVGQVWEELEKSVDSSKPNGVSAHDAG